MTRLSPFQGLNEDALSWLTQMDHIVILRARDHEKIQLFRDKLAYRSPAEAWFFKLSKELTTHWEVVREIFVAKWVEKLDDEGMTKKMADLTQAMNPLRATTATLDTFSITTEEQPSSQAHRALKKLINDILDRLDDEQAPATLQNLNNSVFIQGFRTGYREAYKQWGEEVEERLDEAYNRGIKDERQRWKGTQTNTKPRDAPTPITVTVETAAQTNPAPNHRCVALQTEPTTCAVTDSSTQTTATCTAASSTQTTSTNTADAVTQTIHHDETTTSPSLPPSSATSLPTTPTQPPSTTTTSSSTTTTAPFPAPKPPPTPLERRHTLPGQPPAPQLTPQPLVSSPEPPPSPATSSPTTATKSAATAPETTTRAVSGTQTATGTQETVNEAVDDALTPSTAQETESCAYAQIRSSERVVCSTDESHQHQDSQLRPRSPPIPPCHPQLAPLTPVLPPLPMTTPNASMRSATSSSTCLSTSAVSPPLPRSGTQATARKRRSTHLHVPEQPPNSSQPPCLPQEPRKRAVSPPPASYTPATSLMTLSTPVHPRQAVSPSLPSFAAASVSETPPVTVLQPPSLVEPPSSPVPPCSTPVPTRLDWAEDSASMPAPPNMYPPPRDLSTLRTGRVQPFGTLRRRTRRRRAPAPPFFSQSRKSSYPTLPPFRQYQPFITRCHPSGIGPGKPIITIPIGTTSAPAPALKLDWDQDPRLVDLSRALRALGWTPPC
jgi:hypothetical protein